MVYGLWCLVYVYWFMAGGVGDLVRAGLVLFGLGFGLRKLHFVFTVPISGLL